jgi:chromosome segregation ATPase
VEYEEWFDDPAANIEKLRKFLDLPWQQSESDLALLLSDLIDPTARHDDPEYREANQPLVRSLYKLASRAGQDGEARDQIAYIVSQFVGFQQLQRPFQRAFEEVAKVAAKFPEVEQAAVALRAAAAEREAVVEASNARAAAVEGRLAEALAEIEQQQAQIAEIGGELQAAQADAAVRTAALAQAQRAGQERTDAAAVMQAEVATLREALAHAERAEQERSASAEGVQAEVVALWDSLGQLRDEAQQREVATLAVRAELEKERAATTAALQGEIATLRGRLAQIEGEARERAATTAGLQAEIEMLQGTLTAARQVGKAAIAAFRIETAAPAKPVVPRGWRQAIMRFLGAGTSF